jgi:serine/threonine protein kinase
MSPEAVQGKERDEGEDASPLDTTNNTGDGKMVAQTPADLWALGAIAYNLMTGCTPYWSPSPYLAFLKIKRALLKYPNLRRNMGIVDEDCWDFIRQLMQGKASQRLGANVFQVVSVTENKITTVTEKQERRKMVQTDPEGYNILRNHPFFDDIRQEQQLERKNKYPSVVVPIPSFVDLCIRATAEMAYRDSLTDEETFGIIWLGVVISHHLASKVVNQA